MCVMMKSMKAQMVGASLEAEEGIKIAKRREVLLERLNVIRTMIEGLISLLMAALKAKTPK